VRSSLAALLSPLPVASRIGPARVPAAAMGNFLVFKAALQPSFTRYAGMRLDAIERDVHRRFLRMHRAGLNAASANSRPGSVNAAATAQGHAHAAASHVATAQPASHSASTSSLPRIGGGGLASSASASTLARSSAASRAAAPQPAQGSYGFELDFPCFQQLFPGMAQAELVAAFSLWDTEGTGVVDALELLAGLITLAEASWGAKIRALFALFDFDDSGGLCASELTTMMQRITAATHSDEGQGRGAQQVRLLRLRSSTCLCHSRCRLDCISLLLAHDAARLNFVRVPLRDGQMREGPFG